MIEVVPLDLGSIGVERPVLEYGQGWGDVCAVPMWAWLVKSGQDSILVDCGPPAPDWCRENTRPVEGADEDALHDALVRHGQDPRRIKGVVLTHLHWDHCGGWTLFDSAELLVQRRELAYARSPLWVHQRSYWMEALGLNQPPAVDRLTVIDGDARIFPGVEVIATPGHTPGSQSVRVGSGATALLMVGDTVSVARNLAVEGHIRPGGIYVDLEEYLETLERLPTLAGRILPGHEPAIDADVPLRVE